MLFSEKNNAKLIHTSREFAEKAYVSICYYNQKNLLKLLRFN